MEIKEKIFNFVDNIYNKYLFNYQVDLVSIKNKLELDIDFEQRKFGFNNIGSIYTLALYRLCFEVSQKHVTEDLNELFFKLKSENKHLTNGYISPYSFVDCPIIIGDNVSIDKRFRVNKVVIIGNNVSLIDIKYTENVKSITIIEENVIIGNNVKIYSGADIEESCVIRDNCEIRESIPQGNEVKIIDELQLKKSKTNYLPSQELTIYGIVPKYKNTFVLYGEGIYNPKVKLIVQNCSPTINISYWDKNKIIVKIDYFDMRKTDKSKLIIFSNGQRVIILNSIGLQKTLKNLQK